MRYYNASRTHLALDKDAPIHREALLPNHGDRIVGLPVLGGLHHRYERRAELDWNAWVWGADWYAQKAAASLAAAAAADAEASPAGRCLPMKAAMRGSAAHLVVECGGYELTIVMTSGYVTVTGASG